MKKNALIASMLLSSATISMADVNQPDVFPKPQQIELQAGFTHAEEVSVTLRSEDNTDAIWQKLPEGNDGAYAINITPGKVQVWANTPEGAHYAKQTLIQLLRGVPEARNAQKDPYPNMSIAEVAMLGMLPLGQIIDWPDLPFRGTVEGYYGAPWSFEARKAQFEFYGRNKMNTYIYAPKDDPYHHGMGCYKPYPADKATQIRELVKLAHANHVRFVWAIHPANTVQWNDNGGKKQLEGLINKLEWMYELGVRDFGVLVDDSSGEIGKAERQVQLCNYLLENFIHKHADVNQTLIMCPTGYNKAWTNAKFLNTLGTGLHPTIPVMWTGDTVVHDITLRGQKWVNEHVKRPTFIWWNWPCNDFKRSRISMGRTYGLDTDPEMKNAMSGFVANPMEHAEASKVGLFGVADYTWNITGFESDKSWKEGIRRLYPECPEAMQVFCNHNSYLLPNGHGYFREESVDIKPTADLFIKSLEVRKPDAEATEQLKAEFANMEQAGITIRDTKGLEALQMDIAPWIAQFILTGKAGHSTMQALQSTDNAERMRHFFNAVDTTAEIKATLRDEWSARGTIYMPDVEVAMYAMTPALKSGLTYLNSNIFASLTGREVVLPSFSTNGGPADKNVTNMSDGNLKTFWSSDQRMKKGDWYCIDFKQPTDIRTITLLMGGPRAGDFPKAGVFEVSNDGQNWQIIDDEPKGGAAVVLNLTENPVQARMLRYRITEPNERWMAICEFSVNRGMPAYATTNIEKCAKLGAFTDKDHAGINRVMEVFPIAQGEFINLEFPTPVQPTWVEINLENEDLARWATVELTTEDGVKKQISGKVTKNRLYIQADDLPKDKITSLRLTNTGNNTQEIKLTLFRMGIPEVSPDLNPYTLVDTDMTTFYNCSSAALNEQLPLPANTAKIIVIGTADTTINGDSGTQISEHIREYAVPANVKKVNVYAPQEEGKRVYEVIFIHENK